MKMKSILNFLARHITWLIVGSAALLLFRAGLPEYKTMLLLVSVECLAIALSGIAAFVYTKIDFTVEMSGTNLGLLFLGVHFCIGMAVLGVYLAQFGM